MNEKIQKILANAGVGSRRQVEQWIREERIMVNGKLAQLGERPLDNAKITIDGRIIDLAKSQHQKQRVLIYHKPEGEVCTRSDPEKRPTIFDSLPGIRNGRWISVGRLDFNTTGLLLITNDGELANRLMHPSTQIEREYAARIRGEIAPHLLSKFQKGILLEDGLAHFDSIVDAGGSGSNHWYHVVVKEGRNRLVRRLFEAENLQVSRLIRVRFGSLALPQRLSRGRWQELEKEEIEAFVASLDRQSEIIPSPYRNKTARPAPGTGHSDKEIPVQYGKTKRPAPNRSPQSKAAPRQQRQTTRPTSGRK